MALGYMPENTPVVGRMNAIQTPTQNQSGQSINPGTSFVQSPMGPSMASSMGPSMVSPIMVSHPQQQVWETYAASLIDSFMNKDANFAQYHELLKCIPGSPTVSGLMDSDYPNLEQLASTMKSVSQIRNLTTIPLPTGLVEQFSHMQSNCEMGIFTEMKRCWLTIDSNIFLWNYDNGSDVAYYDGLTETILGVGLIRPKRGVFKEYIKYLLCLTTSVEIVILGVTFTEEDEGLNGSMCLPSEVVISDLLLIPEPMFTLPTDNVIMNVITGSSNGRIFLGTKNGHVYEVVYNSNDSWFTSKCYKVNHSTSPLSSLIPSFLSIGSADPIVQIEIDDSRNILYTRSESGTIEVFDLGTSGTEMISVAKKTLSSIVTSASVVARTIDPSHLKPIVSMNAIEESESSVISLLAVTESGVRFFFSTYSHSNSRPDSLQLVHVRLPPGFSSSSSGLGKPSRVHLTWYKRGTMVFISIQNEESDNLCLLNNDMFAFYPDLIEVSSVVNLGSRVWKVAEERRGSFVRQLCSKRFISDPMKSSHGISDMVNVEPPLLVTQDMEEERKFVLLSSSGVHILYKPRPMDHLKEVLIEKQGVENEGVKGFFQLFGPLQASIASLSLACNQISPCDRQIAEWATLAFFKYSTDTSPLCASSAQGLGGFTQGFPPSAGQGFPSSAGQGFPSSAGQGFPLQGFPPSAGQGFPLQGYATPSPGGQAFGSFNTPTPFQKQPLMASSPVAATPIGSNIASPMVTSPMVTSPVIGSPFLQSPSSAPFCQGITSDPFNDFSVRHNSLYQYFSRIVRPFWNHQVTLHSINQTESGTSESITSSIPVPELVLYIKKLTNLKEFMVKNIQLPSSSGSNTHARMVNYANMDPSAAIALRERNSLNSLICIINSCLETLNLWKILLDHQFHTISTILAPESILALKSMTFKDVILTSTGHEVGCNLASALIQKYIEDNSTTDAISKRLVDSCPSIFKSENALTAKAHEKIMKAKGLVHTDTTRSTLLPSSSRGLVHTDTTRSTLLPSSSVGNSDLNERAQLIDEAFTLFKKIGERINLSQAVELLLQVNGFNHIIDLCLKTAQDRDPQNIAHAFYKSNHSNLIYMNNPDSISNSEYHRGLSLYQIRMDCYNIMMGSYQKLQTKCETIVQPTARASPNVSRVEGSSTNYNQGQSLNSTLSTKNFDDLIQEEAEELSNAFIKYLSSKSADELSHVALYDYLFHHKKHDKLLSIKSPFLEEYLKRKTQLAANSMDASSGFDSITLMDLLWMFYERNGHFRAAAEILSKLSEKSGSNIDLYQRMEYLARAIVCLKSSTSNASGSGGGAKSGGGVKSSGELLHEMEEKMDVARIQLQLLEAIRSLRSADAMVEKLNRDLLDITACYEIAEKFNLPEHQLAIVVAANHFDPGLIENFWKLILDKLISECSNKSPDSIKVLIENKLINLGTIYLPSEKYFPIDFIIYHLESKSSRFHLPETWLTSILIDGLNLSLTHLLTIYHKLYKSKGANYSWTGKDIQLLTILCHLISRFASSPHLVPRNERRTLVTKCLDVISGYLLDLQTITTADGKRLIQEFKIIQNQLTNFN